MIGYYKNEEANKSTVIDGWIDTGDIGVIYENGRLSITGRTVFINS